MSDEQDWVDPDRVSPDAETVPDLSANNVPPTAREVLRMPEQAVSPDDVTVPDLPVSAAVRPARAMAARPPGTAWPPARPMYRRRETTPPGLLIALFAIAATLVLGGLSFILYSTTVQYRKTLQSETTITARQAAQARAAAQVQAQRTANGFATANANIYASATAQAALGGTQTAVAANTSATVTALNNAFTDATKGTPTFNDSLSDNTGNNGWDESNGTIGYGCSFTNSAYHAIETRQGYFQPCYAGRSNFSNFIYQVQMTINSGTQGGILFRVNSSQGTFYMFRINVDGSYALDLYDGKNFTMLSEGSSPAITTGLTQSNQIAVIADHSKLSLYVNQQYITNVSDTQLTAGKIGVTAYDSSTPTDISFTNAQVWEM